MRQIRPREILVAFIATGIAVRLALRHMGLREYIFLLIGIGLVIRIALAFTIGVFYDEGVVLYKALEISDGTTLYSELGDNRTPIVISTLGLLLRLPGLDGNVGTLYLLRSMFVLFSLLTIPIVYAIGRDIFNQRVGLIAAVFVTFEPLMIGQSFQVIPETVSLYFILIAVFFLVRALVRPYRISLHFFVSGFFFSLALLSHLYASLSIAAIGLFVITAYVIDPAVRQRLNNRFILSNAMLLLGASVPLFIYLLIAGFTGTLDDFLTSMFSASTTTQVWHSVGFSLKLDYLRFAILHVSSIVIWVLGIGGLIHIAIKPRPLSCLLVLWVALPFTLNLVLPQSPGYSSVYMFTIPPLAILAGNMLLKIYTVTRHYDLLVFSKTLALRVSSSITKIIFFRIGPQHILIPLVIVVIILVAFGFYGSINSIRDPGHKVTITTPPLSDQLMISSFLANSTDTEAKFLTFTTSYIFLSDRKAVNHFTFGPEFATRDQLDQAIRSGEIDYVLLDRRSEYRLGYHYAGEPLASLKLLAWVKIINCEDQINDGMNIVVYDSNNKNLNHWVYCRNWTLPVNSSDMIHTGQQVEEDVWSLVELNISQTFLENYGYYPDKATIKLTVNANHGSDIEFQVDGIVIYDDESLLYYEDFEGEDYHDGLIISGTGTSEVVNWGYESGHSLSLSANNGLLSLGLLEASSGILRTIYENFSLVNTFNIHKNQFSEQLSPVYLFQIKPKHEVPEKILVEKCHTEFRNDDSTREAAWRLYGYQQIEKHLIIPTMPASTAYLRVLIQENGNASPIRVSINGYDIGELETRSFPNMPYHEYEWREVAFNANATHEGLNEIVLRIPEKAGNSEYDFWRIATDMHSSGNSFFSPDGSKWYLRDDELMMYVVICEKETLTFKRVDLPPA